MRIPSRAVPRFALAGVLGLACWLTPAAPGQVVMPTESSLPSSTLAFFKVNNAASLREAFRQSQVGQLLKDPAMKPLMDDFEAKLEDTNQEFRRTLGIGLNRLVELPEGPAWLAVQSKDDPKVPISILLVADSGKNQQAMTDVLTKLQSNAEAPDSEGQVSTETFKNLTLHISRSADPKNQDAPPLVWTNQEGLFFVSTDVDAIKGLISQPAAGRAKDSLATNPAFAAIQKKLGTNTQGSWFLDIGQIGQLFSRVAQAGAQGDEAQQAQQIEAMLQLTGLSGLKGIGGSLAFNVGDYDTLSKTIIYAPGPVQGILKAFKMPLVNLRPEPWVPASAASYASMSWDLDNAYSALNNLAIAPGLLDQILQNLTGPDGKAPTLDFQKDVFGPLGNRLTIIRDFKKPVTETSYRSLFAVALDDPKAFQNTLNKLAQNAAKKRDFQGTTIYEFETPTLPNAPQARGAAPAGLEVPTTISVAASKGTLFVTYQPDLLEQVLKGGAPLADAPAFQSIAKQIPEQTSTFGFDRSEELARPIYDLIKSGDFQKFLEGANMVAGADVVQNRELIDPTKVPDFSIFAKYLSNGGDYGIMGPDGLTMTRFILRKANP